MSTSCETVPGSAVLNTVVSTSTVFATAVSTGPASTLTTSTPVVTSSCLLPTILGDLALCQTSTTFAPVQTVVPGAVTTITSSSESLVTIIQTSQAPDRTTCSVLPSSTAPSSSRATPTSTSSPSSTPSSSSSTFEPAAAAASTSVTFATTTVTAGPTSTAAAAAPADASSAEDSSPASNPSEGTSTSAVSAIEAVESSVNGPRRITSYVTSFVTVVDASGRTRTSAETVPTLLNMPASSSSSSNVGAIAGGTVGGLAALILVGVVLFLMRKKRGCFGKGDEEIEDDVWNPAPHSGYYGGGGSGAGAVAAGAAAGGLSSLADEKVVEEARRVDAATLERHQSWYKSLHGHGSELDDHHEDAYGGVMVERSASPVVDDLGNYAPQALAYASRHPSRSSHGPQRSLSNRLSAHSHSLHSHEGPMVPVSMSPVSTPDHRLSQLSQYGHHVALAPPVPAFPAGYAEHAARLSPPPHSHSPPYERMRSTSKTALQFDPSAYIPSPAHRVLARQRSLPGVAIPAHVRSASYAGPHSARPSLGALQLQYGASGSGSSSGASSASPSRGRTDDSLSSGSDSLSAKGRTQSYSMPVLGYAPSGAASPADAAASPTKPRAVVADDKDLAPKVALPTLERLKRPAMGRADSTESLLVPSQFLGARIVNADQDAASLAGRSVESLTT
ncbi:uncharacterized protein RHOBADRAFT_53601 [Rhodotorula graminis WP1]|uniref:Uncharacterized protein n=1 Tax=Rhodotorula graminis (strain WP1) TaxID=578459 RepID=A0A194S5E4_RHOGW|nr:uncharacterized protein RHOBADRAFT_53601 [Rhodotorula graminis WP1]KPV74636.1 hypothetical protein RHOBADRAFT_53601 [Rhodotorula graminis WP1]